MIIALFTAFFHFFFTSEYRVSCATDEPFVFIKKEGTISLYERWIPNQKAGKVRELKVVFTVKTSKEEILKLLKNGQKGVSWNPGAAAYKVEPKNALAWLTYIHYDVPFPFCDQDCCISSQVNANGSQRTEVCFKSITSDKFPAKKGVNRMTGIKGKWILNDSGNGNIEITYMITTDKSMELPRCISDPIVHSNLFKMAKEFTNQLKLQ